MVGPERAAVNVNLKHELRTPLNHIIGYCELLLEEEADRGSDRFAADIRRVHGVGRRLLTIFNELFESERSQNRPADRAAVHDEVRTLLRGIIGDVEMLQEEVAAAALPDVLVDLGRIAEAARELLRLTVEHLLQEDAASPVPSSRGVTTFVRRDVSRTAVPGLTGAVLLVDDDPGNRDMLSRRLIRLGNQVTMAANGREAIEALARAAFDLMLLDIEMPELNGFQVLERLKSDPTLPAIPVIVLSASDDDAENVAYCIEMGAEDYLPKPFDPVLLQARLTACLEKKRLRDREQLHLRQIRAEQDKNERLLLNILPQVIADRLKRGEQAIADSFPEATVLFADLVGFTSFAAGIPPSDVVAGLNEIFSAFDQAVADLGLEKIKTIGDSYMAVGGLPVPRRDHAEAVAELALRMHQELAHFNAHAGTAMQLRVGVHLGPVVAGIIGRHKYVYDLWGDAVNVASRMESHSLPGRVQVTSAVEERLRGRYTFEARGPIAIKGIGRMSTFFLVGRAMSA